MRDEAKPISCGNGSTHAERQREWRTAARQHGSSSTGGSSSISIAAAAAAAAAAAVAV